MKSRNAALAAALVSSLLLTACAAAIGGAAAARCGEFPTYSPPGNAPTPLVAVKTGTPGATFEPVMVIGAWSDCFRPEPVTVRAGQLVQWQANDLGVAPELVLEDGTSLGRIQMVLEYRFVQPGTFRYHVRSAPGITGTIVVQ